MGFGSQSFKSSVMRLSASGSWLYLISCPFAGAAPAAANGPSSKANANFLASRVQVMAITSCPSHRQECTANRIKTKVKVAKRNRRVFPGGANMVEAGGVGIFRLVENT